jgi:hypothetical protein
MSTPIDFRLRFPTGPGRELGPALRFTHWLPVGEDQGIVLTKDGLTYRYWIGTDCWDQFDPSSQPDFQSYLEVTARYMYVSITGFDAPDEMVQMYKAICQDTNRSFGNLNAKYGHLPLDAYDKLCRRAYETAVIGYNQIVAYCQANKGQYWLEEWKLDAENILREFHFLAAQIRFAKSAWQPWLPPTNNTVIMGRVAQPERCISKDDWPLIQEFLASTSRPDLVGTLLANAERHQQHGLSRISLIEAVAGLDYCIHQFAHRCRNSFDWFYRDQDRFGVKGLQSHVDHLGITCTVSYLFPIIFKPEQVSSETLKAVQEAVAERNGVVHKCKRRVDVARLGLWLSEIRALCLFLGSLIREARSTETEDDR